MSHTPAPWMCRVEREATENSSARFFIDGPTVAGRRWVLAETKALPSRAIAEAEANARVIAAAPDLLKCLKYALAHIDGGDVGGHAEVLHNGYAAIAKAEGR